MSIQKFFQEAIGWVKSGGPLTVAMPYILAQSAIPVIIPSSGTISSGGVITVGTAFTVVWPNAWVYLPAGAVVGGSAGFYYAVFSSTTQAQIYTNYILPTNTTTTPFTPYIPTSPVVAVGSGSAYVTPTGSNIPCVNIIVPANVMGANGALRVTSRFSANSSATNKNLTHQLNGATAGITNSLTTQNSLGYINTGRNRGVVTSQTWPAYSSDNAGGSADLITSVNTANAQPFAFLLELATLTTDWVAFTGFTIEVLPHL